MARPAPEIFAARVRSELARLGLTYDEAAAKLGATRTVVRQYRDPKLSTLCRLVRELGMDPKVLAPELQATKPRKGRAG